MATSNPTERRPAIPSDAEFAEALKPFREAAKLIDVAWNVRGVGQFKGERAPTFEEIGRMFAFVFEAKGRLGAVTEYVKDLGALLEELDYVRLLDNKPDYLPGEVRDA